MIFIKGKDKSMTQKFVINITATDCQCCCFKRYLSSDLNQPLHERQKKLQKSFFNTSPLENFLAYDDPFQYGPNLILISFKFLFQSHVKFSENFTCENFQLHPNIYTITYDFLQVSFFGKFVLLLLQIAQSSSKISLCYTYI